MDRLGRSLQHLVAFMGELHAKDVDLYLHVQGLDTTTPAGRAMFGMCGVFAEFERAMLVERTKAGLARARAKGKTLGRPRKVTPELAAAIRAARAEGRSLRQVGRAYNVSAATVQRAVRAGEAP